MDLVVNFPMFWKNVIQINAFQKCKIIWKHVLKNVSQGRTPHKRYMYSSEYKTNSN